MKENQSIPKNEWSYKQKLILITGSVIITAAVYLGFKYIFPSVAPFLIAYLIALVIEKPVRFLSTKMWGKKSIASTIIVIILTAVLLAAISYLGYLGFSEIRSLIKNFDYYMVSIQQKTAKLCLNMDGMLGFQSGCCMDFICSCADRAADTFASGGGTEMIQRVMSVSVPIVVNIALISGAVIVTLISIIYLSNVLDKIRQWRQITVFRQEVSVVTESLKRLMNVYFKIQLIIMAINATCCVVGLLIIKNPYAIVIGLLVGLIDALPFFGTGTILIPWAIVDLLFKDYLSAAVLISVYVITYFVREIMESKCMGDKLGIAPFTMLMVIFIGIMVYGIMGFILGPISYCLIKALILNLKTVIERGTLDNT
jgi:sporulation integral membrane protein YtvI